MVALHKPCLAAWLFIAPTLPGCAESAPPIVATVDPSALATASPIHRVAITLTFFDPALVAKVRTIAASRDEAAIAAARGHLLEMLAQLAGVSWKERVREDLLVADARAGLRPTPELIERQTRRFGRDAVIRVLLSMREIGGDEVVRRALAIAENEEPPPGARLLALLVVERHTRPAEAKLRARAAHVRERLGLSVDELRYLHEGGNTPAAVVARMRRGFRRCYESALRRDGPDLEMSAKLTLHVDAQGTVAEMVAEGPMSAEFRKCLVGVAEQGDFDPPEGGRATIILPVGFVVDG